MISNSATISNEGQQCQGNPVNAPEAGPDTAADLGIIEKLERLELSIIRLHNTLNSYDQKDFEIAMEKWQDLINDNHLFI